MFSLTHYPCDFYFPLSDTLFILYPCHNDGASNTDLPGSSGERA